MPKKENKKIFSVNDVVAFLDWAYDQSSIDGAVINGYSKKVVLEYLAHKKNDKAKT